ncbi:hypothetical protein [Streptomyces sp. AK02-01A]|uniref:hypothetical protein n=1 Tax=Streptomyces sp. AK02-01A TaxID=3028648 RepID=UPI0029AD93F3|nr:hypothetical protein [Streptomyces sp. AK02-01A]MDX3854217.1 hypothetical protein [Streptomyces sp. AK02-01A]
MRPYAVEGLDCSGKKTITRIVEVLLRQQGLQPQIVIGPLIGGALGRLDARLANLTGPVGRGSATDLLRRSLYVAEPVIDHIAPRATDTPVLKVSTHLRAWARAELEDDRLMVRLYSATSSIHGRFAGAALLHTDFPVRLERHRADAGAGRTAKDAARRFFGPDSDAFARWHNNLDRLMTAQVPHVLRLDSTTTDPAELATQIARHATSCWERDQ